MSKLELALCGVLFIAGIVAAAEPDLLEVKVPKCQRMPNYNVTAFPSLYTPAPNVTKPPIENDALSLLEFRMLEHTVKGPMLVVSSFFDRFGEYSVAERTCRMQYGHFCMKMMVDHPDTQFVSVKCPSKVCDYLNTTSFVKFDFYRDGQRKATVSDGDEMNAFLDAAQRAEG